jgi:hypothetical protein
LEEFSAAPALDPNTTVNAENELLLLPKTVDELAPAPKVALFPTAIPLVDEVMEALIPTATQSGESDATEDKAPMAKLPDELRST